MYSCHHTNNRRIKADLIVEWRKERLYTREKIGQTGQIEICRPNGDRGANRQQRSDMRGEVGPTSLPKP